MSTPTVHGEYSSGGTVPRELGSILRGFIARQPAFRQACVYDGNGACLAATAGDHSAAEVVHSAAASCPRAGLRRLLVETGEGLVVVAAMPGARWLAVAADPDVRLGAVWMNVDRLLRSLDGTATGGGTETK